MKVRFKPSYKVAVFGAKSVGKTTLICQASHQVTTEELSRSFSQEGSFPGDIFIVETPSERTPFHQIHAATALNGMDGGLLMFSLTDKESFDQLPTILKRMKTYYIKGPILLIANKADLIAERKVDLIEVVKFTEDNGLIYKEVSATNDSDISAVFQLMAEEILRARLINDIESEMIDVGQSRVLMRDDLLTKCREVKSLTDNMAALEKCGKDAQNDHEDRSGSRWFGFGPLFKSESTTKKIADDLIAKYKESAGQSISTTGNTK